MRKRKHTTENQCFKMFHNENMQHTWSVLDFQCVLHRLQKSTVNQGFKVLGDDNSFQLQLKYI